MDFRKIHIDTCENLSCGSPVFQCGRTDKHDEANNPIHKFENAPEVHMKNKNKGDPEQNTDCVAKPGRACSPPSATAVHAPSALTAEVAACFHCLNKRQSCPYTDLDGICEIKTTYGSKTLWGII